MADDTSDPATPARNMAQSGATLLVTGGLLWAAYQITMQVLGSHPSGELVAAIVTAWIVGPIGSIGGFWLGSSVGARTK